MENLDELDDNTSENKSDEGSIEKHKLLFRSSRIALLLSSALVSVFFYLLIVQVYFKDATTLNDYIDSIFLRSRLSQLLLFSLIVIVVLILSRTFGSFFSTLFVQDLNYKWQKRIEEIEGKVLNKREFNPRQTVTSTESNNDSENSISESMWFELNEFELLEKRIEFEIDRLILYSRQNLLIGVVLSIFAMGWLLFSNQYVEIRNENDLFIKYFPRVSVAILMELVSFFFLRLYVKTSEEIKYYHNEKTNIDFKKIALISAKLSTKEKVLDDILLILASTERNFVLKKGEHQIKLDQNENSDLIPTKDVTKIIQSILDKVK